MLSDAIDWNLALYYYPSLLVPVFAIMLLVLVALWLSREPIRNVLRGAEAAGLGGGVAALAGVAYLLTLGVPQDETLAPWSRHANVMQLLIVWEGVGVVALCVGLFVGTRKLGPR